MHPSAEAVSIAPIESNQPKETTAILLAIFVFACLSIWGAVASKGFLEADSCTHFLYAKYAWVQHYLFVNVWGRPVCTSIYALGAHFAGRLGVRLTSLAVAIAISLITRQIAKGQPWQWPVLALIFTLCQPLVFLHSFSELTELPFALLLVLGFWAYQHKRFFWMALVIGITPLSRPEGFGFLLLAGMALMMHRRPWWILVLVLPLASWNFEGWVLFGRHGHWYLWLKENWPYAQQSLYEKGPLLHFVMLLPVVTSPFVFPAMLWGLWKCFQSANEFWQDHRRRCDVLIAVIPLIILLTHSLLYWLGKMASNGELRYMLVVAPFWGLLAARGWPSFVNMFEKAQPLRWAALAALLPIGANFIYGVVPIAQQPDWKEAEQIAEWYKQPAQMNRYPYLATSHPGILYEMDLSPSSTHVREWSKSIIDPCPPGTIVVWDPVYSVFNSDTARSIPTAELVNHGWKEIDLPWSGDKSAGKWRVFESASTR